MKNKLVKRADLLVLLFVILGAGALFLLKGDNKENLTALIYEGGTLVREIRLSSLTQPEQLRCGDGNVVVALDPASAAVLSSDCPSQTCVHTGLLTKGGDTAVCIPNQVTVTLRSGGAQQYQTY